MLFLYCLLRELLSFSLQKSPGYKAGGILHVEQKYSISKSKQVRPIRTVLMNARTA